MTLKTIMMIGGLEDEQYHAGNFHRTRLSDECDW